MSDMLADLPDEVREAIAPHMEPNEAVLSAIGVEIAAKRDEAKATRASSGIESTWKECEEAYLGIDDANRHEFTDARWAKPMAMDSPLTTERQSFKNNLRSTIFLGLTRRYVDAGVAKLGEILLPADDKAFSFDCTPVPEVEEATEDDSHVVHSELGVPLTRPAEPGETPPVAAPAAPAIPLPVAPGAGAGPVAAPGSAEGATSIAPPSAAIPAQLQAAAPPRVQMKVKDLASENIELARKKAKAAETRIYDWMVETNYRAEIRKVIADAARIGVGVLKGPVPQSKRSMAVINGRPVFKEKIVPGCEWKDPWDIFPDPACGENINNGAYIFERDHMSARQVRGLKKMPGYIESQIDQVLEEGPDKINRTQGRGRGSDEQKNRFEIWYFYGQLTKDEMAAIDRASGNASQSDDDDDHDRHEAYCIVTLINDSVVRATINPLDSGSFPFHSMPWTRRAGHWAGVGVAEQMRTPQRVTNAALRAMLNNAGKSAGSQFFINTQAIAPMDDSWVVTLDKFWGTTNDSNIDDIRKAFSVVQIPNVTEQLMSIITLGERFAEETTSIPLIAQGQSGATTPDTFGAAQLQNNNANQLLRSIGYAFDDYITEPVVRMYYEWLLLAPEKDVPDEEKGDWAIDAHGSVRLVERAIQDQTIAQMGGMAANPIYGIDPKKWSKLFLKSKKLAPDEVMYTEEEQQKLDAAPQPEAPAVAVAKINADTQLKIAVMGQTADQQTAQAETQIAAAAHVLEIAKTQTDQQSVHGDLTLRAHEIDMEHQRATAEELSNLKIALDKAKTELAKTAMQLQTERELNAANQAHEQGMNAADQAHEQDQTAANQAHERDSNAASQAHEADQNAASRAHERDQTAANQAHEMRRHVTPQPPRPAVQVPGRAGNGQAASQAPA